MLELHWALTERHLQDKHCLSVSPCVPSEILVPFACLLIFFHYILSCLRWPVNAYKTPIKGYALSFFSFFRFHSSLLCCFILSIVSAFVSSALLSRTQPSSLYVNTYLSLSLSSTFVFPSSSLLSISVRFHLSVSAVSSL